jgi:hypothetical protein
VSGSAGRIHTRAALARLLPAEHTPTPFALTDLFARDLDQYAEIIVGPGGHPTGFMTRGEGPAFTERGRVALEQLGLPEAALAHHDRLSELFEHQRAFLKIEWHVSDVGVEPMAACYFRRRPSVTTVADHLTAWGVSERALALTYDVAGALEKASVHFVAAAFRPGQPVWHKLYFSQLVAPDTRDQVSARIARVFQRFRIAGEALAHWRAHHDAMLPDGESSLFVSVSFSSQAIMPSFKIDYPAVPAHRVAAWLPPEQQARAVADAESACALAGTRTVTFLGVRFQVDRVTPSLKYYCDVPAVEAPPWPS